MLWATWAALPSLGEPRRPSSTTSRLWHNSRESRREAKEIAWATWGIAYSDLGEPRKAIEFYEQALAIAREIGDRRGEGADLGNLGNAYSDLGEPRKAIEFYEQA